MARNKTKICFGCQLIFEARCDARTCSTKCRKRFQRAKNLYYGAKPLTSQNSPANIAYTEVSRLKEGNSYAT